MRPRTMLIGLGKPGLRKTKGIWARTTKKTMIPIGSASTSHEATTDFFSEPRICVEETAGAGPANGGPILFNALMLPACR